MALYQSELVKDEVTRNSAAAAVPTQKLSFKNRQDSRLNSFVTLDNPGDNTIMNCEGGSNSF
jgi:hypothetical protein